MMNNSFRCDYHVRSCLSRSLTATPCCSANQIQPLLISDRKIIKGNWLTSHSQRQSSFEVQRLIELQEKTIQGICCYRLVGYTHV